METTLTPLEAKIQSWLGKLLTDGTVTEKIIDFEDYLTEDEDNSSSPVFALADLAARNALRSARHGMSHFSGFTQVMSANQNISAENGDSLRPDFVLVNPEQTSLILVEIKRSAKTARETVTELLGYEHEIRNHFPFLSHLDLIYVVVSTDFPVLLDHSLSGLMSWDSKKILCLKLDASGEEEDWKMNVHLPESWNPKYKNTLTGHILPTYSLVPYHPENGLFSEEEKEAIWARLPLVMELIAREGDFNRSHGFCMLWQDLYSGIPTAGFMITIGAINPFGFLQDPETAPQTKLAASAFEKDLILDVVYPASLHSVVEKAKILLKDVCTLHWEAPLTWEDERHSYKTRALPHLMEFWGALGEYARDFVTSDFVRNHYLPEIKDRNLSWTEPFVGLTILDELSMPRLFANGKFTVTDIFKFGVILGELQTHFRTVKNLSPGEGIGNQALLYWKRYEVFSATLELRLRYYSAENMNEPPPMISSNLENAVEGVENFRRWMAEVFLKDNEFHAEVFNMAFYRHPIFSPDMTQMIEPEVVTTLKNQFMPFYREALKFLTEQMIAGVVRSETGVDVRALVNIYLNKEFDSSQCQQDANAILQLSDDELLQKLDPQFLGVLDTCYGEVFHPLVEADLSSLDWSAIKRQVLRQSINQESPVVVTIYANGQCSVSVQPNLPVAKVADPEVEVLIQDERGGFSVVRRKKWADLIGN